MSHYFENDPNLKSNRKLTSCSIYGKTFSFYTDNGVFAKNGLDYGSRLLLLNIPLSEIKGTLLDVGCGYGALGIILASSTGVAVTMIDINKRALKLAALNSKLNKIENITIKESDCYQEIKEKYDTIVTNPPIRAGKKVVYKILREASEYLKPNGKLYFVIHKDQGAKSIVSDLKDLYNITIIERKKGFFIIRAENC